MAYLPPEQRRLVEDIGIMAREFIDTRGITEYDAREVLSDEIQNEVDSVLISDYYD